MANGIAEDIKRIRNFESLLKYLQRNLDWPIDLEEIEDMAFEYKPEELGLDNSCKVQIQEIRLLRPFTTNQPWGVFWIEFENRQLPVVVMRRILRALVPKKRATARAADRAVWNLKDLLFVSSLGEKGRRRITFSHFREEKDAEPTLETFSWDDSETHLYYLKELHMDRLRWPSNTSDVEGWRRQWSAAFSAGHRQPIRTAQDLSQKLAELARRTRDLVIEVMKYELKDGPLHRLFESFQKVLIHDLKEEGFADMVAQTIAYGLFSARCTGQQVLGLAHLEAMVPNTNRFLKELFAELASISGHKRGQINFDDLGLSEMVDLLRNTNIEAVLEDFGRQSGGGKEDPVVHFYETFLHVYDKQQKVQRGVFYTPKPVVSFIVRSVHEILQKEFALPDGLADTTTWGEMAARHPDLKIPAGMKPDDPFVQILDPATGTGTFLEEVIDVIHRAMSAKWGKQGLSAAQQRRSWNDYVPKHLLPRVHGFELMMAPYSVAHMKLGLKLRQTGYEFQSNQSLRVYLTNALDAPEKGNLRLGFLPSFLSHEVMQADAVKEKKAATVVIGNPPYSLLSANLKPQHRALIEPYKFIEGTRIKERAALQLEKNLNDDYVKFLRLAQSLIDRTKVGVLGMITNHSFLDNPTMRGVRCSLMVSASHVWITDLHGNSTKKEDAPDNRNDVNVFQIKQGVAITFLARTSRSVTSCLVRHHDLWGLREPKEDFLSANDVYSISWQQLNPTREYFLFIPQSMPLKHEFETFVGLPEVMPINGAGYITARDNLVVDFDRNVLIDRIRRFKSSRKDDALLLEEFKVAVKKGWDVGRARKNLKQVDLEKAVIQTNYRPFDERWIFFDSTLVWGRSWPTMKHLVRQPRNLSLLATRLTKDQWDVWVARTVSSHKAMSAYDTNSVFPLYLVGDGDDCQKEMLRDIKVNFTPKFLKSLADTLGLPQAGEFGMPSGISPEDIFHYIYAVFWSPGYRARYSEALRMSFPRVPLPTSAALFRALSGLGAELTALHLLESPLLDKCRTRYVGRRNPVIEKVQWSGGTVWLDGRESTGFTGISERLWNFHVGGYQVCSKWLKDRKNMPLSNDAILHYQRIVAALEATTRLMEKVDHVIGQHGRWPFVKPRG